MRHTATAATFVLLASQLGAQHVPERFASWTSPTFPAGEYVARRKRALDSLARTGDVLLVPSAEGTSGGDTFRQHDDFEYFTGLELPRSLLLLDGRAQAARVFAPAADHRFFNPGRPNDFPGRVIAGDPQIAPSSGLERLEAIESLGVALDEISRSGRQVLVNVADTASTPVGQLILRGSTAEQELVRYLGYTKPAITVATARAFMSRMRMIKTTREIELLRRAAEHTVAAIRRGAARVRPGVDERALTGEFIADCMRSGSPSVPFTPIIKSGPNSLWPWRILGAHYERRNRTMLAGEMVIYDVGCEYAHYVSDVGRTFPVGPRFTPAQRRVVEMVRAVSDAVIAAAKPGLRLIDLQAVANAAIPAAAKPYMQAPVFFGHHLGLDSGDPFLADALLEAGMVFTVEPWYYNHEQSIAAFIEDVLLITPSGAEVLTASLPRSAIGLERLRNAKPAPTSPNRP